MIKHILQLGMKITLVLCVLLCVLAVVLNALFPLSLPDGTGDFSVTVYAQDGTPLRTFADKSGIWRQKVDLDQVSDLYIQALVGYEDRWFWHHPGVNPAALLRAAYLNLKCGCIVSGGSTLTMQVARRFYPMQRTVWGKVKQMARALQMEWYLSKREILNLYLNYTAFGGTIEGVEAASWAYLEKSASELTHADAALLAVLPQAPSRFRPDRYPKRAQRARNKVLKRLLSQSIWDKTIIQSAFLERVYATKPTRPRLAPLLSEYLKKAYPKQSSIQTTVDAPLQQMIQDDLSEWVASQPLGTSAAVLVIDHATQAVKAYVGTARYSHKENYGYVDMVRAIRSPGSTLKPFIYAFGIEKGLIHSHSLLSDAPRYFERYRPENFNHRFAGAVSATYALRHSLNVPAVQVLSHVGAEFFDARLRAAGVDLRLPLHAKPNLSMALGGVGINLWQLTQAYTAFAQNGQIKPLVLLQDQKALPSRFLTTPEAAWITHKMLASNSRLPSSLSQLVKKGAKSYEMAYKTGTSYGYRDAWSVGVSATHTIGVWVGRPDGTPQPGFYGARSALPILFQIADAVHGYDTPTLKQPKTVNKATICWPLGQSKENTLAQHCHREFDAWLNKGLQPKTWDEWNVNQWQSNPMTLWVNQRTQRLIGGCRHNGVEPQKKIIALWPRAVEPFLPVYLQRVGQIPKADPLCPNARTPTEHIKIVGVKNQNTYLVPRLNAVLPTVALSAVGGSGRKDWFVNGRFVLSTFNRQSVPYAFKSIGEKQIIVVDENGDSDTVTVSVQEGL